MSVFIFNFFYVFDRSVALCCLRLSICKCAGYIPVYLLSANCSVLDFFLCLRLCLQSCYNPSSFNRGLGSNSRKTADVFIDIINVRVLRALIVPRQDKF